MRIGARAVITRRRMKELRIIGEEATTLLESAIHLRTVATSFRASSVGDISLPSGLPGTLSILYVSLSVCLCVYGCGYLFGESMLSFNLYGLMNKVLPFV